jgi:hypothetical protein
MFRSTRSVIGASKSTEDWYQSSTSIVNAHRGAPDAPFSGKTGARQRVIE